MISVIGYQDDVIGFGLIGIAKTIELKKNASKDDVLDALRLVKESNVVIINESLLKKIEGLKERDNFFFVIIPDDFKSANLDYIEKITRETLGISMESKK
jgi:vacuolar-type H+-ATPase subunit F/Vma7